MVLRNVWYYQVEGIEVGPVTLQTLQQLLATGQITAQTCVRTPRSRDWRPAAELLSKESRDVDDAVTDA